MDATVPEVILTTRCRLRRPTEADIAHVWSATRYPDFNEGLRWDAPTDIAELQEPLKRNRREWAEGKSYAWTIEERGTATFIGRIVIRAELGEDEWSVGFWVHPKQQRQGYALEAVEAVIDVGFGQLGARVISAACATWNTASQRVLEKAGMSLQRTNPEGFKKRGAWVEEYEYELRRRTESD